MAVEQFVDTLIFQFCHDCGRRLNPTEKVRVFRNKEAGIMLVVCTRCLKNDHD